MTKIGFAIIGCGKIAKRHAIQINRFGRLLAVCDIVPERAKSLAEEYKVKAFTDIDELLLSVERIDVVAVQK